MKKKLIDLAYSLIVVTIISLITSCGESGSGDAGDTTVKGDEGARISGMVIDENGLGVANVKVYTTPPTGTAFTDSSGSYTIKDSAFGESASKSYTVHAERAGYQSSSTTITIGATSDNIANLTIRRSVNGLVAQDSNGVALKTLTIGKDEDSTTFILTSTTPNNTFRFSADKDWLTITPVSGSIDEITAEIITVKADKSKLSDGVHTATIIGNGNTQDRVQLTVTVAKNATPPPCTGTDNCPPPCTDKCKDTGPVVKNGIKFDVPTCSLATDGELTCEFYITRLKKSAILEFGGGSKGTTVSAEGIVYKADYEGVYLGGQQAGLNNWTEQTLTKDVPMLAKAVFSGLPPDTKQLSVVTFAFSEGTYDSRFKVIFKDIPISK